MVVTDDDIVEGRNINDNKVAMGERKKIYEESEA